MKKTLIILIAVIILGLIFYFGFSAKPSQTPTGENQPAPTAPSFQGPSGPPSGIKGPSAPPPAP